MSPFSRQRGAESYAALLEQVRLDCGCAAEDDAADLGSGADDRRFGEVELQGCWQSGLLGCGGETSRHGFVRIIDFGTWNRSAGPDFLRAEIELDGRRLRGDIELDTCAQDWERHGHGSNPDYDGVVLHVVLGSVPRGWFTRNSRHGEIPVLGIPSETCRLALGISAPLSPARLDLCREPLARMTFDQVQSLLESAASYRKLKKHRLFCRKARHLGGRQAWYEAWAETLGYRINKVPMQLLARRAPIGELGKHAEAILFGTAGFLVPVLPEQTREEARLYHRTVWDAWWPLRERFALSDSRCIPWSHAAVRPLNHPHRRVAALAVSSQRWGEIEPLLKAACASELTQMLTSLRHPYWSRHCSLPSEPLSRDYALVGRERVRDFLVNHVYVVDESDQAWSAYLRLRDSAPSSKVKLAAARLFGEREDVLALLPYCYAQQALLQIDSDFCCACSCGDCRFPSQLRDWQPPCE